MIFLRHIYKPEAENTASSAWQFPQTVCQVLEVGEQASATCMLAFKVQGNYAAGNML